MSEEKQEFNIGDEIRLLPPDVPFGIIEDIRYEPETDEEVAHWFYKVRYSPEPGAPMRGEEWVKAYRLRKANIYVEFTPTPDKRPFFTTLEEEWTFYENIASDLYELLDKINLDFAALSYLGTQTADMETMRYLLQRVWEHYKKLADEKSKLYFASAEFQDD